MERRQVLGFKTVEKELVVIPEETETGKLVF